MSDFSGISGSVHRRVQDVKDGSGAFRCDANIGDASLLACPYMSFPPPAYHDTTGYWRSYRGTRGRCARRTETRDVNAVNQDRSEAYTPAELLGALSRIPIPSSRSWASSTSLGESVMRHDALVVLGNAMTSRIDDAPVSSMMMRSNPRAIPPCGGAPSDSASSRWPNRS